MLRLIEADLFRLRKAKSFWIACIVMIGLGVVMIVSKSQIAIFSTTDTITAPDDIMMDGMNALAMVLQMGYLMSFFFIPCFTILFNQDILKRTYKNVISHNISRTGYLFSKLIAISVAIVMMFAIFLLVIFGVASLLNGVGEMTTSAILNYLTVASFELFLIICWESLIITLLILTQSAILSIMVVGLTPIFLYILAQVLNYPALLQINVIALIGMLPSLSLEIIFNILWFSVGCLGSGAIISLIVFNKQDLK